MLPPHQSDVFTLFPLEEWDCKSEGIYLAKTFCVIDDQEGSRCHGNFGDDIQLYRCFRYCYRFYFSSKRNHILCE
jgi:hypothetical protein